MKKKVKLFATIASLCLAVCLMAFGVWAASTATLGVTSSVSYKVDGNVHVKFEVSVSYTAPVEGKEVVTGFATTAPEAGAPTGGIVTRTWDAVTQDIADSDKKGSITIGDLSFAVGATQNSYIEYKIVVTNLGQYAVKLEVKNLPKDDVTKSVHISRPEGNTTLTADAEDTTKETADIAKTGTTNNGDKVTMIVRYTLNDVTQNYDKASFAPSLVVTAVETSST